jgi:hypothetical protein
MTIRVKLKLRSIRTRVPTTVNNLSAVILAPPNTIFNNPEELMFRRVGQFDYQEVEPFERDLIRAWCQGNKVAGNELTLTDVERILKLAAWQKQKGEDLERSKGESEANEETETRSPTDDGVET